MQNKKFKKQVQNKKSGKQVQNKIEKNKEKERVIIIAEYLNTGSIH